MSAARVVGEGTPTPLEPKDLGAGVMPDAREIWQTLKAINVNEHTKEKGGLTYLSWAWAYSVMMDNFPEFSYRFMPDTVYGNGNVTVNVEAWIGSNRKSMWLPVMDNRNNAVEYPDGRAISDTRMRALVKCMAMFGLGSYIYAGEDIPEAPTAPPLPQPVAAVKEEKSAEAMEAYEASALVVSTEIESATEAKELKAYYKANKKTFMRLETEVPDIYNRLISEFKAKIATFEKQ